jgi:NAD+ kinase
MAEFEIKRCTLLTHRQPENVSEAIVQTVAAAEAAGVELIVSDEEFEKHPEALAGATRGNEVPSDVDLCLVLGGDGTLLHALRTLAGTEVPVFGINFGTVGFLAASERDEIADGLRKALSGEFRALRLPGLELAGAGSRNTLGLNDISFARLPQDRVAEISYRIAGEEVGHVRCDGLVAATPAGSTGYNLANGGPILAWGVEGYVVSFIAPHTLTARALVVAPDDVLHVGNAAGRDSVEISIDGVRHSELAPGEEVEVHFRDGVGVLAQLEGSSFYQRIGDKFGRLSR